MDARKIIKARRTYGGRQDEGTQNQTRKHEKAMQRILSENESLMFSEATSAAEELRKRINDSRTEKTKAEGGAQQKGADTKKEDSNSLYQYGMTPLCVAAAVGNIKQVYIRVKSGSNPNEPCADGSTALILAMRNKHLKVAKILLKYGADPTSSNLEGQTVLMEAVNTGDADFVNVLWVIPRQTPINLDQQNKLGCSALHLACNQKWLCCVDFLLNGGASPNLRSKTGETSLMYAARTGFDKTCMRLIEGNAGILVEDFSGRTAIEHAIKHHQNSIALLLLDKITEDEKKKFIKGRMAYVRKVAKQQDADNVINTIVYPMLKCLVERKNAFRDALFSERCIPSIIEAMRELLKKYEIPVKLFQICCEIMVRPSVDRRLIKQFGDNGGPMLTLNAIKAVLSQVKVDVAERERDIDCAILFLPIICYCELAEGQNWIKQNTVIVSEVSFPCKANFDYFVSSDDMLFHFRPYWEKFLEFFDVFQQEMREKKMAELIEEEEREKAKEEKEKVKREKKRERKKNKRQREQQAKLLAAQEQTDKKSMETDQQKQTAESMHNTPSSAKTETIEKLLQNVPTISAKPEESVTGKQRASNSNVPTKTNDAAPSQKEEDGILKEKVKQETSTAKPKKKKTNKDVEKPEEGTSATVECADQQTRDTFLTDDIIQQIMNNSSDVDSYEVTKTGTIEPVLSEDKWVTVQTKKHQMRQSTSAQSFTEARSQATIPVQEKQQLEQKHVRNQQKSQQEQQKQTKSSKLVQQQYQHPKTQQQQQQPQQAQQPLPVLKKGKKQKSKKKSVKSQLNSSDSNGLSWAEIATSAQSSPATSEESTVPKSSPKSEHDFPTLSSQRQASRGKKSKDDGHIRTNHSYANALRSVESNETLSQAASDQWEQTTQEPSFQSTNVNERCESTIGGFAKETLGNAIPYDSRWVEEMLRSGAEINDLRASSLAAAAPPNIARFPNAEDCIPVASDSISQRKTHQDHLTKLTEQGVEPRYMQPIPTQVPDKSILQRPERRNQFLLQAHISEIPGGESGSDMASNTLFSSETQPNATIVTENGASGNKNRIQNREKTELPTDCPRREETVRGETCIALLEQYLKSDVWENANSVFSSDMEAWKNCLKRYISQLQQSKGHLDSDISPIVQWEDIHVSPPKVVRRPVNSTDDEDEIARRQRLKECAERADGIEHESLHSVLGNTQLKEQMPPDTYNATIDSDIPSGQIDTNDHPNADHRTNVKEQTRSGGHNRSAVESPMSNLQETSEKRSGCANKKRKQNKKRVSFAVDNLSGGQTIQTGQVQQSPNYGKNGHNGKMQSVSEEGENSLNYDLKKSTETVFETKYPNPIPKMTLGESLLFNASQMDTTPEEVWFPSDLRSSSEEELEKDKLDSDNKPDEILFFPGFYDKGEDDNWGTGGQNGMSTLEKMQLAQLKNYYYSLGLKNEVPPVYGNEFYYYAACTGISYDKIFQYLGVKEEDWKREFATAKPSNIEGCYRMTYCFQSSQDVIDREYGRPKVSTVEILRPRNSQSEGTPNNPNHKKKETQSVEHFYDPADAPEQKQPRQRLQRKSRRWRGKIEEIKALPIVFRRQIGNIILPIQSNMKFVVSQSSEPVLLGLLTDGTEVAVKVIDSTINPVDKTQVEDLIDLGESNIFLLRYRTFTVAMGCFYLAMDLYEYTLDEYLHFVCHEKETDALNSNKLVWQLLRGLSCLHDQYGIAHGNLKPSNIVIDQDGTLKITGYGLGRDVLPIPVQSSTTDEDRCWQAPEYILQQTPHTVKSDVHVAGMLVYFILSGGKHPYGTNTLDIQVNLCRRACQMLYMGEETNNLLASMMSSAPAERPSISEVLSHPYFWASEKKLRFILIAGSDVLRDLKAGVSMMGSPGGGGETMIDILSSVPSDPALNNWIPEVDQLILREMRSFRQYKNTMVELVLFIYNCCLHFEKMSDNAREVIDEPCKYFLSKFPALFMTVYRAIKGSSRVERTCYVPFF